MPSFFKKRHGKDSSKSSSTSLKHQLSRDAISQGIQAGVQSSASFNVISSSVTSPTSKRASSGTESAGTASSRQKPESSPLSRRNDNSVDLTSPPPATSLPNSPDGRTSTHSSKPSMQSGKSSLTNTSVGVVSRSVASQVSNGVGTPVSVNAFGSFSNSDKSGVSPRKVAVMGSFKEKLEATPWRKKRLYNSPFPRFSHSASATTSDSGAVYLMGGLCGKNVFGDMWVIEPVQRQDPDHADDAYPYVASPIENFDRMPAPRIGHACVLIGNAFIVFAGDTVTSSTQVLDNRLYFFNITSLKWTVTSPKGPGPSGRYGHQIAVLNFEVPSQPGRWLSYLYVFGGQLEDEYYNDIWKFDLTNFRNPDTHWTKIDTQADAGSSVIPPSLANHTMTAFENRLYAYGGTDGHTVYGDLYCFDPLTEAWTKCALHGTYTPPPLQDHAATLYQNLLFIYGGKLPNGDPSTEMYVIDLKTFSCWKILSKLPFSPGPRCGHSMTADIVNERLLIMGGDQPDKDFTDVYEDSTQLLDETNFAFPSSVIYEFDLQMLPQFMEKVQSKSPSMGGIIPREISGPRVAQRSANSLATSQYADADLDADVETATASAATTYSEGNPFAGSKQLQAARPISLESAYNTGDMVMRESADEPLPENVDAESASLDHEDVGGAASSTPKSIRVASGGTPTFPPETSYTESSQTETESGSGMKTPERAPSRPVMNNLNLNPTPVVTSIENDGIPDFAPDSAVVNEKSLPRVSPRRNNMAPSEAGHISPVKQREASESPVLQRNLGDSTFSSTVSANEEGGGKIQSMAAMLQALKKEMQEKVTEANNRIVALEQEKGEAQSEIARLKKQVDSPPVRRSPLQGRKAVMGSGSPDLQERSEAGDLSDASSDTDPSSVFSSREKIKYENQLLKVNDENAALRQRFVTTDSYVRAKIEKLLGLSNIVKSQQQVIGDLKAEVVDQAKLKQEIVQLRQKNESVELELKKLQVLHADEAGEAGSDDDDDTTTARSAKRGPALSGQVTQLSNDVGSLLQTWSATSSLEMSDRMVNEDKGLMASTVTQKDATIAKLQAQVDQLLGMDRSEENTWKTKLATQEKKLHDLEDSYKKSVNSLNNTHRALSLSQTEIEKLRENNKRLNSELEDWKLKKRVSSTTKRAVTGNGADSSTDDELSNDRDIEARYGFKIRDLEADLFIATQERDRLREEVITLKKKIYTSPELSATSHM